MVNYLISGTGSFKRQTNKYTVEFFDDDIENLNFIFHKKTGKFSGSNLDV